MKSKTERYTLAPGDSLLVVAKVHQTTVELSVVDRNLWNFDVVVGPEIDRLEKKLREETKRRVRAESELEDLKEMAGLQDEQSP